MEILEARVEHLEAELEGFQDAIHRQSVLRDERLDELDRADRTPPDRAGPQPGRAEARSLTGSSRRIDDPWSKLAITASAMTAAMSPW